MARGALGHTCYVSRQPRLAIPHLQAAMASQAAMPMIRVLATALLSLCHGALGDHRRAADLATAAAGLVADLGLDRAPQVSFAATAQAAVAYRAGDFGRARDLLERSLSWRHRVPGISPWPTVTSPTKHRV